MAAAQRRLLTAENSRLGKVEDLTAMLQKEKAWASLSRETREHLYTLLPPASEDELPRDPDVNPLLIPQLQPTITKELDRWQVDLREGRETKKWRSEAMQAGKDRGDGKFEEWKEKMKDEYWGKPGEGESTTKPDGGERTKVNGKTNALDQAEAQGGDGVEIAFAKDSEASDSEL